MENKNLRPNGPPVEIKPVKSDLGSSTVKLQTRNGKRRDNGVTPKNTSGSTSTGAVPIGLKNPKPWLPRQKASDRKQQRNNVGSVGAGTHRKNDHQVTDSNDPDLDLVLSETGKKQNLAHLLNMKFQFAPRDTSVSHYWRATHSSGDRGRKFNYYSGRAHLNKDHYLQANCQFVVKADGDYSVYLADPDLLVPWESIEQIRIWGSEVGSCPICLHSPVAAKMTRCGHIYCWPCILHFLALSDKPSRPCPICDVSIKIQDLKSVVALEQRNLKIGDILEMRLMKRDRHSLLPQPISRSKSFEASYKQRPSYLGKAGEDQVFSKLLLCTPNEVVDLILNWEKIELQTQLEAEKDCPESCFIQQALELLLVREQNTAVQSLSSFAAQLDLGDVSSVASPLLNDLPQSKSLLEGANIDNDGNKDLKPNILEEADGQLIDQSGLPIVELNKPSTNSPLASPPNFAFSVTDPHYNQQQKNVFYFYQSNDGQAIYLHPINVQILVRSYGSLEMCPETIQGRIVEVETLSMTEELRNRLRYLGHIPVSKQFQIMEIALIEPQVDSDILEEFRERIEERARRRRRKDREERRRDLEIQRAEDAKWGRTKSQPIVRLDSKVHFPGFSPSSNEPDFPKVAVDDSYEISPSSLEYNGQCNSGPSFAQMLREGKNKVPSLWSALPSREVSNTSYSGLVNSQRKTGRYRNESESETEVVDYTPVPEYKDTFSSAIAAAFDNAAKLKNVVTNDDGKSLDVQSKKNKKKVKQKVLFSTGMNFM